MQSDVSIYTIWNARQHKFLAVLTHPHLIGKSILQVMEEGKLLPQMQTCVLIFNVSLADAPNYFRYYYNKRTKQSSWEKPLELMTPIEVSYLADCLQLFNLSKCYLLYSVSLAFDMSWYFVPLPECCQSNLWMD